MGRGYKVIVSPAAVRDLDKISRQLDDNDWKRLWDRIHGLAGEPRTPGTRKIVTRKDYWRVRSGDWRVVYEIDDIACTVVIAEVSKRGEITYRNR